MKRISLVSLTVALASCGGSAAEPTLAAPSTKPVAPFENPGGMWMPSQLSDHAGTLRRLGLELDPAELADPTGSPLGAIVSLGGCSASFVSSDGLIITNHHCVKGALQYHSKKGENLVETGFLAKTRADEKWNGPTAKVWVTQSLSDVTDQVLAGLDQIADDHQRYETIEKREKEIVAACENDRPEIRCKVSSFFRGAQYLQIEMLEVRDVRLVYAPSAGIGWFGGDEDNWMWPRHTGDFSFYRAYVGPDGKPADYSKNNVPYKPAHYLKIAEKPLAAGDLVMVAGYPGRTYRHRTAAEVDEAVSWRYPRSIARNDEYLVVLRQVSAADEEAAIKAQGWMFGLSNAVKNYRGMMDGLVKGGLAESKKKLEADLRTWIAAEPTRKAKYGDALDRMNTLFAENHKMRDRDAALGELGFSSLLGVASTIVQMAEERPKPDADRDPSFQERNWKRIEARFTSFDKRYNRALDRALLKRALERAARKPEQNGGWLALVLGGDAHDAAAIEGRVERLYAATKLEDQTTRLALFQSATTDQLKKSSDAFIQLALALRPLEKEIEDRDESYAGAMALLRPKYIAALREMSGGKLAPDANSTLRVTYGTVRGYRPKADADMYEPFTVLSQVVAKHRDEAPFDVPDELLAAAKEEKYGPYVDAALGEIPVNFLADLDTTGGNSGSATLNARGELVGLIFDGNYEAMASDWLFIPELTRSIHVDIRYVLWIMDAVDKADHLLEEMGIKPAID